MSTARPTLEAVHREVTGKAVSRLRREGLLPAVVFGHGLESDNVTLNTHDFELLRRASGRNTLIDLKIDGRKARPVLVHGVQYHPVHRNPLHVDLFVVRMTEELVVDVPLVPVGQSIAVEQASGTLIHVLESVKVRALPDRLPQSIEYSIEPLGDFDAAIHVTDLPIPDGVTLLNEGDEVVARVLPPRIEHEAVAAAEGEGAEGEAAGGAETGAEPSGEEGSES